MSIKFMKINKYEPAADEKRLEELAAKGEFIKSHFLFLGFFRKGEPKKVRYSIEPKMNSGEKKHCEAYAECGWKRAANGVSFNVFMSDDKNAVPLHTDRSEYAHVVKSYHIYILITLIVLYIVMAADVLMPFIFFPLATGGKVQSIFTMSLRYDLAGDIVKIALVMAVFMFPMVLVYLWDFIKAGRFVTGCIENRRDAARASLRNNIMTGFFVFLLILDAAIILFQAYISSGFSQEDIPFTQLPDSIITIEEIYGDSIEYLTTDEAAEKYIDPKLWDGAFRAFPSTASELTSVFADCSYDYWQHAAYICDGREQGSKIDMHNTYTIFKNEWIAEESAEELIEYEEFFFTKAADRVSIDAEGTPYEKAECLIGSDSVYFVLLQGRTVHTVDIDLPLDCEYTAEMLFEGIIGNCKE